MPRREEEGELGSVQGAEVPLAPAAEPLSSSWSRSATSCDVDMPASTAWWYLRCSSCCTWPRPKPIRSTACTAGHWLHTAHSRLPPASARQGEGCWAEGRPQPGPWDPWRGRGVPLWLVTGAPSAQGASGAVILARVGAVFPEPVSEALPPREDVSLTSKLPQMEPDCVPGTPPRASCGPRFIRGWHCPCVAAQGTEAPRGKALDPGLVGSPGPEPQSRLTPLQGEQSLAQQLLRALRIAASWLLGRAGHCPTRGCGCTVASPPHTSAASLGVGRAHGTQLTGSRGRLWRLWGPGHTWYLCETPRSEAQATPSCPGQQPPAGGQLRARVQGGGATCPCSPEAAAGPASSGSSGRSWKEPVSCARADGRAG